MNLLTAVRQFVTVVLRRLLRDRTALFFMTVLPVVVIVIIGVTFGNAGGLDVGVVNGSPGSPGAASVVRAIDASDGTRITWFDNEDDLRGAVRRQSVSAGVVLPTGFDEALANGDVSIRLIALPDSQNASLAHDVLVSAAASVLSPAGAARLAGEVSGADPATAAQTAGSLEASLPAIDVATVDVGREQRAGLSQFSLVAPQELVLFVFINAMASGAALVRMRRTGVLRRVLAGPGGAGTIVAGVLTAWVIVALLQSLLILSVGSVAFDVDWGSPVGAGALVLLFSLVGAGAGLMVGALGGNEDRVGAITPPIGIVLGALGGCMVPLEVFSPTMRSVAHAVPQYWAMTAWQRLIFDGEGIGGITMPLLALAGFAVVFLTGAVLALHRSLLRGAT
ncbi:MAG: ABC transporter permease [Actinomycetota bacterium]|nr:ABC transporter permease [Actinomycetota bacterium]